MHTAPVLLAAPGAAVSRRPRLRSVSAAVPSRRAGPQRFGRTVTRASLLEVRRPRHAALLRHGLVRRAAQWHRAALRGRSEAMR